MTDKTRIFFFSGTGNARNVSKWIQDEVSKNSITCDVIDISRLGKRKIPKSDSANEIIGFVSPTHGFNFPPIMLHFILRFPKAKNKNKIFLVNTRAGMKIGKFLTPGLSGIALLLPALVLYLKGYRVTGMKSIDLPSNWISLHPGLNDGTVSTIYKRRENDAVKFAQKIVLGQKDMSSLKEIIQDLIISPIAIAYYLIGRFILSKTFIASKKCTRCDLCVKKCPVSAIKIIDQRCFWTVKCESCMKCMNICPERAIETAHGFVVGAVVIFNVFVLSLISSFLGFSNINYFFSIIVNSALFFVFLYLSYILLHFLIRFSLFEKIFVYTSLTKYPFWKRYRPPKER